MKFKSTKKFGPISTGHRQWKHKGHCSYVHGYGRYVRLSFEASELDECGWVMDFGDLRDVKRWIEGEWDHKVLIAADDPLLSQLQKLESHGGIMLNVLPDGYYPGIEESCRYLYDKLNPIIKKKTNNRVEITRVEIWEHENNSGEYVK
jgi:6-pyruvoyltetrahydropterin/6-carboxytetrahydropterin synthase|tara:strand:+ start:266 stop:709 length:444 start_codon:yes stop_codon:yes gene_type:complete